jgi:hypothetical protein
MKVIPSDLKLDDHMTTVAAGLMDAVDDELDDVASPQPSHPANIAYVGDHIHGDVLAAKSFGWYAIAIVGETLQTCGCSAIDSEGESVFVSCRGIGDFHAKGTTVCCI